VVRVFGTRGAAFLWGKLDSFLRYGYGGRRPFNLVWGPGSGLYVVLNTVRDAQLLDRRVYLVEGTVMGFVAVQEDAPFEQSFVPCYIRLY
jgi:hypothetical protein